MRTIENTVLFLRMAGKEVRKLAEAEPRLAGELRHIANQCDAEADDLTANNDQAVPNGGNGSERAKVDMD